jgi:DNA primase catalytic core
MPRIPTDELERLKQNVSLERLVEAAGIELKRHGKDLVGRCPFHDDKTPSLVISPEKNLWHCLGACQAGGSVIDWVMKMQGVSFRHAVELLRNDPASAATTRGPVKQSTVRKLAAPISASDDERAALNHVIGYYHETLKGSPEALDYLAKRGIRCEDAIARFKLGYANRTLGLRLPHKNRREGEVLRGQLQRLGILRASGHEHFNGCLVIPTFDAAGNVIDIYGRRIGKAGDEGHVNLPRPHQGVWNLDALTGAEEVILCEALIDALTFWCAGYRHVTATLGAGNFTEDHDKALRESGVKRVLIAYDRDAGGESGTAKLTERLLREGFDCYRIQFPKGMDANEYALAVTPATKSLGVAISKAVWLGKGQAPAITTKAVTAIATEEVNEPALDLASDARFQQSVAAVAQELAALDQELAPSSLAADAPLAPIVLPASVLPKVLADDFPVDVKDGEIGITLGERHYRVRGLAKNLALDVVLKVNVMVSRGDAFHVDTLDLYAPRAKHAFIVQAAIELNVKDDVIRHDLGKVLRTLERLQQQNVQETLTPKKDDKPAIEEGAKQDALALLKEPKLLERILADFERCGVVGEEINKLVGYLAATSRKLDAPLAIMVQSSSAAGKSSLMEAVLAMMPEEDQVKYSAMTGQALYYMGAINLKNKILALAEEAGAARASYALKLLQSEGVLKIASTGKNPETGELVTQEYKVEGPVMIFSTTTAIDNDDELLNRCLTLGVDESREQTRAIHQLQRQKRTLDGLLARKAKARILTQHQNAQRLLRPIAVRNPFADRLTFPDESTRLRRDHEKYLTLIDTIALLHQYQRPVKTAVYEGETIEYVEVTLDDIETANKLAHEALGRSLDELPPQTRRLLLLIEAMVTKACAALAIARADYRFSRRDVREATGISDTPLSRHLDRLVELEYLLVHRGGRGQSFVYELLYDGKGQDGAPFVPGLIDVATLRATTTMPTSLRQPGEFPQGSLPQHSGNPRGLLSPESDESALNKAASSTIETAPSKNASRGDARKAASYR